MILQKSVSNVEKIQDRVLAVYRTLNRKIANFLQGEPYNSHWTARDTVIKVIKKSFPSYQYTGSASFDEIILWCEEHLGDNFVWNYETIYFKHEKDKTFFMLRWS